MRIIDIGCGKDGRSFSDHADPAWIITGVDLHDPAKVRHRHPHFGYCQSSAANLPFPTKFYDLAVSVGMLEHIIEPDYSKVCAEIQRVARQYVILVPFKWAWLEPHFAFPFFGALPTSIQRGLIQTLNLSGHRGHLDYFEKNYRWRSNAEYRNAFPGAGIRFMPSLETIVIEKH